MRILVLGAVAVGTSAAAQASRNDSKEASCGANYTGMVLDDALSKKHKT